MKTYTYAQNVGQFLPNAWGLYDMHGNVYEWCLDRFTSSPAGGNDPDGGTVGPGSSRRVLKGGSYAASALECRSSCRIGGDPVVSWGEFGFRVFKTLE